MTTNRSPLHEGFFSTFGVFDPQQTGAAYAAGLLANTITNRYVPPDARGGMSTGLEAMNPNHKIPVLVDDDLTIFESGAILMYLVEKSGKFQAKDTHHKYLILEWLMFQMASVGPMFGQANHFVKYAPEKIEYAIKKYLDETKRLMQVLETRLAQAPYLAGEYGIADIATWPWVRAAQKNKNTDIAQFPHVEKWFKAIESRDAVKRAIEKTDAAAASKK